MASPGGEVVVLQVDALVEQFQHPAGIADDVVVGDNVLVDFRTVDVDVNHLGVLGKGAGVTGDPIGEPAANGDEQIAGAAGVV